MLDVDLKRRDKNGKSTVTAYRNGQSTGFVNERAMSANQVNRRLSDGIHSLGALMLMLREAAVNFGGKVTSAAPTMEDWGVSFTIGNVLYWTGLSYSQSEILLFKIFGVNRTRAQEIGFGSVQAWNTEQLLMVEPGLTWSLKESAFLPKQSRIKSSALNSSSARAFKPPPLH